jgi:peptidoglycan glycosyltransferase
LRSHQLPIAGKTGTAEVAGRESHGWFVGFAPYGAGANGSKKRIAFAIVIEHAGYGGITAAPAAGEIVSAAAAAGLIGNAPAAGARREVAERVRAGVGPRER